MKASEELHRLIHSLDKSERRYFKLFAEMGAGRAHKHTLELFDRIGEMEAYDEAELKRTLKDRKLVENFATSKNRLYELILKSQRLLRSGENVDSALAEALQDLETLLEKGLVKAARKRVKKAKALALEHEKEATLLQLLNWEQRFFVLSPDESETDFYLRNETEESECMQRLARQRALQRAYEQIRSLARMGHQSRSAEMKARYAALLQERHLAEEPPESSFMSVQLYHATHGVHALTMGQSEKAWSIFHNILQRWNMHPQRIADASDFYLGCYNNFISACTITKTHNQEYLAAIQQVRSYSGLPAATQIKLERIAYLHELNYLTEFGTRQEGDQFIAGITPWMDNNKAVLQAGRLLTFYGTIALFYFLHSEFSKSQKWLNRILHFGATEARSDIRDFARIFQLVLQYELGNLDVNDYLLRSAYRHFNRTQKLHDYEEAVLTFMKTEQKSGGIDPEATAKSFDKLHADLTSIRTSSNDAEPVGMQALLFWTEAHQENVTLGHYYAQKVRERGSVKS